MPQWNASGKRLVMLWMRQIALNRLAHNNEAVQQSILSDRLNITLMVFTGSSALVAVVDLISILLPEELRWISILLSCLIVLSSIVATILAGVLQILKPDEKAEKNRQLGVQYNNLSNIMQKESVIDDPKPLQQFLEEIIDRFSYIQNYGSEVMQDQVSTADLPNLILIKDAERRRRLRAKMEGIATPPGSPNKAGGKDLTIIHDSDHALFDADDYSQSVAPTPKMSAPAIMNTAPQSETASASKPASQHSPEMQQIRALDHAIFDTQTSEDETMDSDIIEDDIVLAARGYDDVEHEVAMQIETEAESPQSQIMEEKSPSILQRLRLTNPDTGLEDVQSPPENIIPSRRKRKSKKKLPPKSPRESTQADLLNRLDAEQQKKMEYLCMN